MARRSLPPVANTYTGILHAEAMCSECPWESWARNALGQGNQHARRTGHQVRVEQVLGVTYNRKEGVDPRYDPA